MSPYYAGGLGIPYMSSMLGYGMGGLGGLYGMGGLGGMYGMGGLGGMYGMGGMMGGMGYPYGMMMGNPYGYSGMVRPVFVAPLGWKKQRLTSSTARVWLLITYIHA